jgi:hypothetical protein
MRNKLLIISTIILLSSACKVKNVDAPKPEEGVVKISTRPLSNINLPISIQIADLEQSLNKQFNGILYNDDSYENNNNDNLVLKVSKIGNFKISSAADKISVTAPLEIYVKGRLKKDFFSMFEQNIGIDQSKDALFRINVNISSKISVDQSWNIVTKSEVAFQWKERPYLELGPVKIPIGTLIESAVNTQIKKINEQLDAEISRLVKIKPYAEQYWLLIQKPIILSDVIKSYLIIRPEIVSISSIKSDGKRMLFYLGMRSDLSIQSGIAPTNIIYKPLPKLQTQQKTDSTFNLYLGASIAFNDATEIAKKEFNGKTFTFENGKQSVSINDINIYNNGDKLGMMLDINGIVKDGLFKKKFKGIVYAHGTPAYDEKTQTLYIKDFDFDVKSKDVLIGTAEWLFKGAFRKQIENSLKYPLTAELERAKNTAQKSLDDLKFEKFSLQGKVERFEPFGVQIIENRMEVVIQAKGNLLFQLKSF